MESMIYRVVVSVDEDGMFTSICPTLPGCISQGATREEAIENLHDAIRGYLESLRLHDELVAPQSTNTPKLDL